MEFSIYVCMNLIKMSCWFNHHFGSLVHLPSSLWCIFSHAFPSKPRVCIGFQEMHLFHFLCVRTLHAPSLACCAGHTLATNKDILLFSTHNCCQGDTVWATAGTPRPNGLRSSLDLLPGRYPDMLASPTVSQWPKYLYYFSNFASGWPLPKLLPSSKVFYLNPQPLRDPSCYRAPNIPSQPTASMDPSYYRAWT